MSIEYRGNNKFRFRVCKDGENYYRNHYCEKKMSEREIKEKKYPRDVIDAHKKYEVEVLSGSVGANENMSMSALAQLVMDEHVKPNLAPNTQNSYKFAYNSHILSFFGNMKISKIKKIQIQKFINEESKNLKASSIESIYAILNSTFSKAIDWGFIKENPCKKITLPKIETKNYAELLSAEEINKLIYIIEKENEIYKVIFYIALYCGLRQGEILALTINDIDLKENYINVDKQYSAHIENNKVVHKITKPKTENSVRKVYMSDDVNKLLSEYISKIKVININPKEQYLFINPQTQEIYDHNALYRRFKKIVKSNNIRDITFHDLRHLHATMLINSGVNIVVIAKRLGDTVETVSNTYVHSIKKVEKESVKQLDIFIRNLKKTQEDL